VLIINDVLERCLNNIAKEKSCSGGKAHYRRSKRALSHRQQVLSFGVLREQSSPLYHLTIDSEIHHDTVVPIPPEDRGLMPIRPFLAGQAFQPETITDMSDALERVCGTLGVRSGDETMNRLVAEKIIDSASVGFTAWISYAAMALTELRAPH
jgi:hypothetical protein